MFTTPAERILKDFVEFGDTGCADHEQSPPYQRTDAAEHYAKLINRNGRYRSFRHVDSLPNPTGAVLNLTPGNLPLSAAMAQLAVAMNYGNLVMSRNDLTILGEMFDYMPGFKRLMDISEPDTMDELCRFAGFFHYAKMSGAIKVPK
jgi:hypothetical protein